MTTNTQKHTLDQLLETLTAAAFKRGKPAGIPNMCAYLWKIVRRQVMGAVCLTNEHLQLDVDVYETPLGGVLNRSVSFSITGEYRPGMWTKLEVYGVSWDEAIEQHTKFEQELLASWDALCAIARKT